jgi:amino acid transporter
LIAECLKGGEKGMMDRIAVIVMAGLFVLGTVIASTHGAGWPWINFIGIMVMIISATSFLEMIRRKWIK